MDYKLGKLPYVHDPRTFHLSTYLPVLPKTPPTGDWGKAVKALSEPWGMDLNDEIGDCGVAGISHAQKLWIANSVGKRFQYTDADIIKTYSALSEYDPKTGANDNGIALISGLKYWQKIGFNGHKIDAYVKVDATNQARVNAALYLFGCLYAGIGLPITAQEQVGKIWTVTDTSLRGDAAPYAWGGHCVLLTAWGDKYKCITWGEEQFLDDQFLGTYADELWVPLSLDFFTKDHLTPVGLKYSQLLADLKNYAF